MRRHLGGRGTSNAGTRSSGTRSNALWGKGRRRYPLLLAVAVVGASIAVGSTTSASLASPQKRKPVVAPKSHGDKNKAQPQKVPVAASPRTAVDAPRLPKPDVVPKALEDKAKAHPHETFQVIVQTSDTSQLDGLGAAVGDAQKRHPGNAKGLKSKLEVIPTATAELTGDQIADLAATDGVISLTEDSPVQATGGYSNGQGWASSIGVQWGQGPSRTNSPTIAIVDSGVQARSDFGGRLLKQVDFTTSRDNSSEDGFGHGTLVAGLAVGGNAGYSGVEPRASIVSLDVLDDSGVGRVSNLLAACDWILQNKDRFDIKIANFSLNAASGTSIRNDPLNRAVEKLWLNGVVVVVAAGNYAVNGAESGVGFSPANDPFVITVGASDTNGTETPSDDFAAPWSAWGTTQNGFRKPELSAPGRMLNGPAPKDSTMYRTFPEREVEDGYMWMSGTSFAAPIVAGAAATLLARHPEWTPDQVKGALMVSANAPAGYDSAGALGVGTLDIARAIAGDGLANPNAGLNQFVVTNPFTRVKSFNAVAWASAAASDPAWNQASWSSASWSSASWSSASWSSASWSSASWSSASWSSASWSSASWASMFAGE